MTSTTVVPRRGRDDLGRALRRVVLAALGERGIGVTLPNFVNMKIAKTDPWVKGDTAAGNNKPATIESGYTLQVPGFVEEGTLIQIDTRTGEYVTRVKE